jgi:FtsP/CotA-like multicopper oxidase with cupredoxin domain
MMSGSTHTSPERGGRARHRWSAAVAAVTCAAALVGSAPVSGKPGRAAGPAATTGCATHFPPVIRDGFPEPQMRFSRDGRMVTRLRMGTGPVAIDGHSYVTETYEGTFPGPTLVICPGDKVTVHVINDMKTDEPTNLHVHGLHVSPIGNHDNVFLEIAPHHRQTYDYEIPADQDPGSFWYHPHLHMYVAHQIFAGLSGAIVVEGGLDNLLAKVPQRLMMIQSTELCGHDRLSVPFPTSAPGPTSGSEPCDFPDAVIPDALTNERYTPLLINGAIDPTVKIRPGQIQRWRIFNANNNRIVNLNLQGQNLEVLAEDGNTLRWMRPTRDLQIAPGSRREVLVRGGPPGRYEMTALPFAQFPGGDHPDLTSKGGGPTPNQIVLSVVSAGAPAHDRLPQGPLNAPVDLRQRHVDRQRTITFSETPLAMNMTAFKINGRTFDANHIAVTMKLGSVEEWKLVNTNTEWHTFHIHVNPFQVVSVDGRRLPYIDYEDNVAMPPCHTAPKPPDPANPVCVSPSTVVIRMRPTDFTGKFVFHCHVTNHEDRGMMAAVQVVRNPTRAQLRASAARSGGFTIQSAAFEGGAVAGAAAAGRQVSLLCHLLGIPAPSGLTLTRQ